MAGRINTYSLIRKIHLYSGFIILAFILMYFFTGYVITHPNLVPPADPVESMVEHDFQFPQGMETDDFSVYIQDKFDLRGKRNPPKVWKDGTTVLEYVRPGYFYEAKINPERTSVNITTRELSARRTLVIFHRLEKYGGGWLYNIYMFMMDLSSLSLIVFAVTGIYLWVKIEKQLIWGGIFLLVGIAYTLGVILSM